MDRFISLKLGSAVLGAAAVFIALALFSGRGELPYSAYRYRFQSKPSVPSVSDLAALEQRVLGGDPKREISAFDLASLSGQYFQMGRLLGDASYYEKAEAAAKRSLALLPEPNSATLTLARLADSRHQFPQAIELAKEAFRSRPSTEALAILVTSYIAIGNYADAILFAEQAVEMRPTLPNLLLRALALLQQGRTREAEYDFKRAVVLEDLDTPFESSRLRALWARYLITRGEYRSARGLLDEALRIWPENALAIGIQGDLALKQKQYARAQERFQKAFNLSKETLYLIQYGEAKAAAGEMQVANEYWNQAESLLRKELATSDTGHRLQLAELLLLRGNKKDVAEAVSLARAEVKNRPSSGTQLVMAKAFMADGQYPVANLMVRAALKSGIQHPDYFELAGQIEEKAGNPPRAAFYRELARTLNPRYVPTGLNATF